MNPKEAQKAPTGERTAEVVAGSAAAALRGDGEDDALVALARRGDLGAFESLFRRHYRAVYRTLLGVTGRPEDAEDAVQSAFVKAFQHLDQFQGTARFSTWLTRIAINEGLARLRERGRLEDLDAAEGEADPEFMPRNVRDWEENPEILRSRAQARELVEREIRRLPPKYRLAVLLRDIQQVSAEEAAEILGLRVATLKTHLLRGRLLLREALAPHFARPRTGPPVGEGRA